MPLVMGVASLAATTTVEVRDADDGRLVAAGTVRHPGVPDDPPPVEQPVEVWWDGFVDAVDAADLRHDVAALGLAAQRGAMALLDATGVALEPASLAGDPRAEAVADELASRLGADRLARATGQLPRTDTPLARLVWRLGTDPSLADRLAAILGGADLLVARLTGRQVTDRAGASATGWWDPVAGRWRTDLLDRAARPAPPAGWAAVLPEVLRPAVPADSVSAAVHGVVGLRGRPLVAAGTTDVAARALAAVVAPGTAAALLDEDGPGAVAAGAVTPAADPSGRVVGLADAAGNHLPVVPVAATGRMLDGIARVLGTDAEGLASRAAAWAAGGGLPGVVVLPGRPGSPGARPRGRPGAVVGLDGTTTPGELARAALLGVAAEVIEALRALDAVGGGEPEGGRLVLAGGVARRPGVAAAVADLAGREVVVVRHGTAATGACVHAAAALGGSNPLDVARAWGLDRGEIIEPTGALDADACLVAHELARAQLAG